MKEFNLEEYNKMCAEFLGWKKNNHSFIFDESECMLCLSNVFIEDLKFHSDWNWIMEVVERIESKGYDVFSGQSDMEIESNKCATLKESAVQLIWQFLNWYKENEDKK